MNQKLKYSTNKKYYNLNKQFTDVNTKLINKVPSMIHRQRQSYENWRAGISFAENLAAPQYYKIISVFQEVSEDSAVYLNQSIRKNGLINADWEIYRNGEEDEKLEEFFKGSWFKHFVELAYDSIFWGYSLIQIDEIENDIIKNVQLISRQNVNPKLKLVCKTPFESTTGRNFETDAELSKYLIFVSPMDISSNYLGIYNTIAPWSIARRMALSGNNEFLIKYGLPQIIYKTDTQDDTLRNNIESYLSEFSNTSYMIGSKQDEIELLANPNGQNDSFLKTIKECSSEIAKIICGSDQASEKSFVGSAKSHEKLLTLHTENDKKFIEKVVNNQLIPKLIGLGLDFLKGAEFKFEEEKEDNTELFNKTIDLINAGFEVDNEWIYQNFGVPVLGLKKSNDVQDV